DYLRAGAISGFAPVMEKVVDAAKGGMPVLGICNGFQILCETHLLPGAMIKNAHRSFLCRDQPLAVENVQTAWTRGYEAGQIIRIPLKNQDGQYVADERTLAQLEDEGRVVFRYAAGATHGPAGLGQSPNGSRGRGRLRPGRAGGGPPPRDRRSGHVHLGADQSGELTPAGPRSGRRGPGRPDRGRVRGWPSARRAEHREAAVAGALPDVPEA